MGESNPGLFVRTSVATTQAVEQWFANIERVMEDKEEGVFRLAYILYIFSIKGRGESSNGTGWGPLVNEQ